MFQGESYLWGLFPAITRKHPPHPAPNMVISRVKMGL